MIKGEIIQEGAFWTFRATCPRCEKPAEVKGLRKRALDRWQGGALVQDVFPQICPSGREILASGMHDACFDEWFYPPDPPVEGWPTWERLRSVLPAELHAGHFGLRDSLPVAGGTHLRPRVVDGVA